jgi:hypothetical protein
MSASFYACLYLYLYTYLDLPLIGLHLSFEKFLIV